MIEEGLTTAQIALGLSAAALTLSAVSLFWAIRSKYLHPKPRSGVRLTINEGDWVKLGVTHIAELEVVNLGPTDCVVTAVVYPTSKKRFFSKKKTWWNVTRDSYCPVGGTAISPNKEWPRLLRAGELCSVALPIKDSLPDSRQVFGLGFIDAFDRMHLISKKQFDNLEIARAKLAS